MNYDNLINKAIDEDCLEELLCGIKPFEIEVSKFTSDVFPTDINTVLVNCIYKKSKEIYNIEGMFVSCLMEMIKKEAVYIYIAILYFDACIFHEEIGTAPFYINRDLFAKKIRDAVEKKQNDLKGTIQFNNGLKKIIQ